VTAVLPPPGQRCGTVFGNRTSPSDNSNDLENIYVWLVGPRRPVSERYGRRLEIFILTYFLTYLQTQECQRKQFVLYATYLALLPTVYGHSELVAT